jgi:hypothetical protein
VRVLTRLATSILLVVSFVAAGVQDRRHSTRATDALLRAPASVAPTTTPIRVGPFGARTFQVRSERLRTGAYLTIGLHPSTAPVRVRITPAQPVEVCPATLDGVIGPPATSWPTRFHFDSCIQASSSGYASLPATDGNVHVAFAISPVTASDAAVVTVSVSYSAEDSFVWVVPPGVGTARATVRFSPHSATAGAHAYMTPGFGAASGVRIVMSQHGRSMRSAKHCDFGSEIECLGYVTPRVPVTVKVAGPSTSKARLAIYLSWA